jgi:DNA-binding HxlR family transcriptional regulator
LEGAVQLFGQRWKPTVLFWLATGPQRRRDLERHLPRHVSAKVLTEQLRGLEADGLVCRVDRTPAGHGRHVTYALTAFGETLRPVIAVLARWSFEQRDAVKQLRRVAVQRRVEGARGRVRDALIGSREHFTAKPVDK